MTPGLGKYLTFWEHLEELRRRLFISLGFLAVFSLLGYFFSKPALDFLVLPLRSEVDEVYFFSPAEAFLIRVRISILIGFLASLPVILSQFWFFVSPALRESERNAVLPLALTASALFLLGVAFCFFVVMPPALHFLVGGMRTDFFTPMISMSHYIGFLSGMLLAFGVAFNLPVFILALTASGVLNTTTLAHYHRHAIVVFFIAAAVLTPGPDIASQLLLVLPLVMLFEISLVAVRFFERRRARERTRVA